MSEFGGLQNYRGSKFLCPQYPTAGLERELKNNDEKIFCDSAMHNTYLLEIFTDVPLKATYLFSRSHLSQLQFKKLKDTYSARAVLLRKIVTILETWNA